jgi:signal transduction histidine kinase/CheY-like chemotaxis protein
LHRQPRMFIRESRLADHFTSLFALDRWSSRFVILFFVLGSVILIWLVALTRVREEESLHLQNEAMILEEAIQDRLSQYGAILQHLQSYLQRTPPQERELVFKQYLQTLDLEKRYPGTQGVGFARYVHRTGHKFRSVISVIEPSSDPRNRKVVGFDMASEPHRLEAMILSMRTNLPTISSPVFLKQELEDGRGKQHGFLIYLPFYELGSKGAPLGFVYTALRSKDFFEGTWSESGVLIGLGIKHLRVTAESLKGERSTLYQTAEFSDRYLPYTFKIEHGLATWQVQFSPHWSSGTELYYRFGPHIAGFVILILSGLVVLSLNRIALQFRFEEESRNRLYHSEQRVRESSEFLIRLHRITRQILSEIEYEGLLTKIAVLLIEECACESVTVIARPLGSLDPDCIDVKTEGQYCLNSLKAAHLFLPEVDAIFGRASLITNEAQGVERLSELLFGAPLSDLDWMILRLISRNAQIIGYVILTGYPKYDSSVEIESLLRHLTSQLCSALENAALYRQARAASEAKTSFMANMSHEIRTPLNAVIGFSEMMSHQDLTEEQRENVLRNVRQSGAQLTRIIDDILDISKVEAGQMSVEHDAIRIPNLFKDLKSFLGPKAQEKGIDLLFVEQEPVPAEFCSDDVRLKQILINLLGNAIKFTHKGFVKLTVSVRDEALVFLIEDTGIGIGKEFRERIFEPFSQGDASTTRTYGGSGLGLALAKRLADLLGGHLTLVSSRLNCGTTFELVLTRAQLKWERAKPTPLPQASPTAMGWSANLKGKHILLVEDSIDNQEIFSFFLEKAGAEVEVVDNGRSAVEKAMHKAYDLILMDIQIPILDGKGATRLLRQKEYKGPIVALTAHALTEQRNEVLNAGCNGQISKPVTGQTLIDEVSRYIEEGAGA